MNLTLKAALEWARFFVAHVTAFISKITQVIHANAFPAGFASILI